MTNSECKAHFPMIPMWEGGDMYLSNAEPMCGAIHTMFAPVVQRDEDEDELVDWLLDMDWEETHRAEQYYQPDCYQFRLENCPTEKTSLEIFMKFVVIDGSVIDASGILSRECFETWLGSRRIAPQLPEQAFRKAVIAHLSCTNEGTIPFPPAIEKDLLCLVRQSKVWPCFAGRRHSHSGKLIKIGMKGCTITGFHERSSLKRGRQPSHETKTKRARR